MLIPLPGRPLVLVPNDAKGYTSAKMNIPHWDFLAMIFKGHHKARAG